MGDSMIKRTASVDDIFVTTVAFSSIFEIGDANFATAESKALSVQQPTAVFFPQREADFNNYPVFFRKTRHMQSENQVNKRTFARHDKICVGNIGIREISQSAMVQIGSLNHAAAEARIMHIRLAHS
ncbi:spore germination protein GerPE [Virgibacillus halophilus]|uniref:Spore germination protein GerPE n=1 Tax=Tigheibacillus halophilus TaxID=361280 RepID=A0ABU5C9P2_9BACI|nr:spore germination protein GerPE [Virgibacillus halophilus]